MHMLDEEEEYETVVYNGPDQPYILVDETPSEAHRNYVPQNAQLQPMDVRLAQACAQYGGLLSPDFFRNSPDSSSSSSSRDGLSSSENICNLYTPPGVPTSTSHQRMRMPFSFPNVSTSSQGGAEMATATLTDDVTRKIERVEILDEDPDEPDESEWVEWPKRFIEQNGFCLGIQPGTFYKNQSRPLFYVKLPHRSNYEVLVTNKNQVSCDLDLYVNGQLTNALRLPADSTKSIDGPAYSKYAFKIFRSRDAPEGRNVVEGSRRNGVVKAVFTPKKIGNSRHRAFSEPRTQLPVEDFWDVLGVSKEDKKQRSFTTVSESEDKVERSLDMSQVVEGVTLLQGMKKKKRYAPAPDMETDRSKRVVLQLRLIASLVEEIDATEGEVYDLEPPPLPSRRD